MRIRYTRSIGLPVIDEETGEFLGSVNGIVLHPDTGVVEGFFVRSPGMFPAAELFLARVDILHWGLRVSVRSPDALSSVDDLVRVQALLQERRPVLGQKMLTESGTRLGTCADVQFNTRDFHLEWLFPKRFFRWGIPVPVTQILEVRRDAIILGDSAIPKKESAEEAISIIPQMPEAA